MGSPACGTARFPDTAELTGPSFAQVAFATRLLFAGENAPREEGDVNVHG